VQIWEEVALDTYRLAVPGGWIYRHQAMLVFVADNTVWHQTFYPREAAE